MYLCLNLAPHFHDLLNPSTRQTLIPLLPGITITTWYDIAIENWIWQCDMFLFRFLCPLSCNFKSYRF